MNVLLRSKDVNRDAFIWNTYSSVVSSFQSVLLTIIMTHFGTSIDTSIYVIAVAVSNLLHSIGRFGVRQFQVTDTNEKYSYYDYRKARVFSVALMIGISALYIVYQIVTGNYFSEKAIVVGLFCVLKIIQACEDVFHGRMQQLGRLDVASKIFGIRTTVFMISIAVLFIFTRNLLLTVIVSVGIALLLCIILNKSVYGIFVDSEEKKSNTWKKVILDNIPLCATAFLSMYITNAPKYSVDGIVNASTQTAFNIVSMPALVCGLLSGFIFNPSLNKLGILWNGREYCEFKKLIKKLTFVPMILTTIIYTGGYFLGIPILSLVYGIELSNYKMEMLVFIIAGGLIAIDSLYVMVLTTIRKQMQLIICYTVFTLLLFAFGKYLLSRFGTLLLCYYYMVCLLLLSITLVVVSIYYIKKEN